MYKKYQLVRRDIKPANFLYDRKRVKFGLVDFGLAQRSNAETKEIPIPAPVCKRKLTSSDLANSMESPPPSKMRKRNSSADCG
jgi:serine/threonine protein kinase